MGKPRAELLALLTLALLTLAACGDGVFQCMDAPQCDDGFCEPTGYCSFDDPDCPSGRRYGDLAGDNLGGTCVPVGDTDSEASTDPTTTGGSFTTSTTTTSATTTTTSTTTTDSDPVTTTPLTSGPDTDADSSGPSSTDSGPAESSTGEPATTGPPTQNSSSFGDRSDADHQGVTQDTSLLNYAAADNMGAHGDLHLDGNEFGSWQVALIRFDISALPQDVTIVGATLSLWSYELSDPGAIDLYAVTEAWTEGDLDQLPGVCNWTHRLVDATWSTEGAGDESHDPTVLASFALDEPESQFDILLPPELIEFWRDDPNTNFGLVLRSTALAQPLYIPSSEEPDELLRPLLVVTYAP